MTHFLEKFSINTNRTTRIPQSQGKNNNFPSQFLTCIRIFKGDYGNKPSKNYSS